MARFTGPLSRPTGGLRFLSGFPRRWTAALGRVRGFGVLGRSSGPAGDGLLALGTAVNPQLLHPARIGIEDFQFEATRSRHEFAPHRNPSDPGGDVAGKSIYLLPDLAGLEFGADD